MIDSFHESVFRYIARIAESLSGQKSDKFQKFPTLCLYHSLSTTQSFGLISLRRVLVSFRLGPFPSTTQSFGQISLRRVLVSFRLGPFPPTTQSFGQISLRRGIEWGIHCAIYRGGGVLANCSGLRDTLGLKRAKPA